MPMVEERKGRIMNIWVGSCIMLIVENICSLKDSVLCRDAR